MPTRNVVLTEHQSSLIESLVGSGRYQNASEVLREGLRLIEQREIREKAQLEALRQAVTIGVTDIESGRYTLYSPAADFSTGGCGVSSSFPRSCSNS